MWHSVENAVVFLGTDGDFIHRPNDLLVLDKIYDAGLFSASYSFLGINWEQEKLKCNLRGSLKNACECPEDVWREMNKMGETVLLCNVTIKFKCSVQCWSRLSRSKKKFQEGS